MINIITDFQFYFLFHYSYTLMFFFFTWMFFDIFTSTEASQSVIETNIQIMSALNYIISVAYKITICDKLFF